MPFPHPARRPVPLSILAGLLGLASHASAQFRYWDVADSTRAPRLLSQTGLYTDIAAKAMHGSAHLFEVNSALWSDGSLKKRWVILKPGRAIAFEDTSDYWAYPDSTVFVKEFALETREGDPASRVLWETRLLILKKEPADPADPAGRKTDTWYGFSYRWNSGQTEATLVGGDGETASLQVQPAGGKPAYRKKWVFPARFQCVECHVSAETKPGAHGRSVLGFFTAQLNRRNAAGLNQITDFFRKGILSGSEPTGGRLAALPKWWGMDDTDPEATDERKSRAYIAANCSGCHGTRGMENNATFGKFFNYDYHTGTPKSRLEYYDVGHSYGLDDPDNGEPGDHPTKGVYLITPGMPQRSVLVHRQKLRNTDPPDDNFAFDRAPNQMPPLATFEVNTKALEVIERWIRAMPIRTGIAAAGSQPLLTPSLRGGLLRVPAALLDGGAPVLLMGLDGRVHALRPAGPGAYALPAGLPKGVYLVRVGARSFMRQLF